MKKIIKKINIFFLTICLLVLISCTNNSILIKKNGDIEEYNLGYFKNASVIIPKNQTIAQSLSIVVKNENNELIVFDGGRIEDADFLSQIIKDNGGKVVAWYLTHIHDDHIGALYQILLNQKYDLQIKNLFFNFADFEWYYEKIGNDAGAVNIFYDAINKYNNNILNDEKSKYLINVNNGIMKNDIHNYGNVKVEVLNNLYKLDSDPINNSSIVYKIQIDDKTMIVFGDLGYNGGKKLMEECPLKDLSSDIVVVSHHGQNGVPKELYYTTNPTIVIWPTTEAIYENYENKYNIDEIKDLFSFMSVKYNIFSYKSTTIIK